MPPLGGGQRGYFAVGIVVAVKRVEPECSQVFRQRAEMRIGDEARVAQRPLAHAQQRCDVEGLKLRIDADAIPVGYSREKSTDSPSTRISSTSVCGTPSASIACFTVACAAQSYAKVVRRLAGCRKSFSSGRKSETRRRACPELSHAGTGSRLVGASPAWFSSDVNVAGSYQAGPLPTTRAGRDRATSPRHARYGSA
jgi:hypothetical protein